MTTALFWPIIIPFSTAVIVLFIRRRPSLQFWIVGRSFALLGRNDFAARLPSILMALAIMLMTYRIGRVMVGKNAAMVAVRSSCASAP